MLRNFKLFKVTRILLRMINY